MLELGDSTEGEHADLGRHARGAGRGPAGGPRRARRDRRPPGALEGGLAPAAATAAGSKEEALALLRAEIRPGDVVLVKASRGLALDTVAEALVAPDAVTGRPDHPSATSEEPA